MRKELVALQMGESGQVEIAGLILSARGRVYRDGLDAVDMVVGRPGLPNRTAILATGDFVLFETPDAGLIEIRVMQAPAYTTGTVTVLLTEIAPQLGIAGGLVSTDAENRPFTPPEIERIQVSAETMKAKVRELPLPPERLDLIDRKIDELADASRRLGKKDWLTIAIGTAATLLAGLEYADAQEIAKLMNEAFSWVFHVVQELAP